MQESKRITESPLADFLAREWPSIASKNGSIAVKRDDIFRYLVWTLDGIKAPDNNDPLRLWDNVRTGIHEYYLDKQAGLSASDIDFIADALCALSLSCLALLMETDQYYRALYVKIVHYFKKDRWDVVKEYMDSIQIVGQSHDLKLWLEEYFKSDLCYTTAEDIEWDNAVIENNLEVSPYLNCNSITRNSSKTPSKIDLVRIIYAMQDHGFFINPDTNEKAGITDVFNAFAKMLNDPSLLYDKVKKDITTAKNAKDNAQRKIFNTLADLAEKIFD